MKQFICHWPHGAITLISAKDLQDAVTTLNRSDVDRLPATTEMFTAVRDSFYFTFVPNRVACFGTTEEGADRVGEGVDWDGENMSFPKGFFGNAVTEEDAFMEDALARYETFMNTHHPAPPMKSAETMATRRQETVLKLARAARLTAEAQDLYAAAAAQMSDDSHETH